jgi:hypothetical protein
MSKSLLSLFLALVLAGPAWPQEETTAGEAEEPDSMETGDAQETGDSDEAGDVAGIDEADEVADAAIVDPDFDDDELDEQTYEEDDDDFVPSEEIPADEPIPFPSNI